MIPYRPRVLRRTPTTVIITARQAQCLDALCDGLTGAEISTRHGITTGSVKTHLKRLYAALGARDRAHAVGLVLTCRVEVLVNDPRGERSA